MKAENLEKIIELRHRLHREPELSGKEAGTIRMLSTFLHEHTSLEIIGRDGWFYAVKHGPSDRKSVV